MAMLIDSCSSGFVDVKVVDSSGIIDYTHFRHFFYANKAHQLSEARVLYFHLRNVSR
jgi:hypothetical protein